MCQCASFAIVVTTFVKVKFNLQVKGKAIVNLNENCVLFDVSILFDMTLLKHCYPRRVET